MSYWGRIIAFDNTVFDFLIINRPKLLLSISLIY